MSLSPSPNEVRKQRTELNFRLKHGQEGLDRLMALAEKCELLEVVADEFNVSRSRMSQILKIILGMPYHVWLAEHDVKRKKVTPPEVAE